MSNPLRICIIGSSRPTISCRTQSPQGKTRNGALYVKYKIMAAADECAKSSKRSSQQRLSLEASLENLRELTSSLETKKTPKQSDFFLSYDSSGKRIRNSKHKYRSVAKRKRNKKDATCGQTICVTGKLTLMFRKNMLVILYLLFCAYAVMCDNARC